VDPFFNFNAATIIIMVALANHFTRCLDFSAEANGATSKFD
jgi:hypothetical protein